MCSLPTRALQAYKVSQRLSECGAHSLLLSSVSTVTSWLSFSTLRVNFWWYWTRCLAGCHSPAWYYDSNPPTSAKSFSHILAGGRISKHNPDFRSTFVLFTIKQHQAAPPPDAKAPPGAGRQLSIYCSDDLPLSVSENYNLRNRERKSVLEPLM